MLGNVDIAPYMIVNSAFVGRPVGWPGMTHRPSERDPDPAQPSETSVHVRRAVQGDMESVSWLADRLHPLLLAQARYRLARGLAPRIDPEDLVQQVWCVCLPKLEQIRPREGRYARVLLSFLSSTLLRIHNNLVSKHLVGKPRTVRAAGDDSSALDPVAALPAAAAGVVTTCMRRDAARALDIAIQSQAPDDRQVLVLRGIEQLPYKVLAANLGVNEATLMARYRRALERLSGALPDSLLGDLRDRKPAQE